MRISSSLMRYRDQNGQDWGSARRLLQLTELLALAIVKAEGMAAEESDLPV
jgi:hypothetical protein